MPRARILPDAHVLLEKARSGLTHEQIARELSAHGAPVARSSVSSAISRAQLSERKNRYQDFLPWRLNPAHDDTYIARVLRLAGRRAAGGTLTEAETRRVDAFLTRLKARGVVVTYDYHDGFTYTPGTFTHSPAV